MVDQTPSLADPPLDWMPRAVRDRLDRVGIKLHLKEWQALAIADRQRLLTLPCDSADERAGYAAEVGRLVTAACGRPPDRLNR